MFIGNVLTLRLAGQPQRTPNNVSYVENYVEVEFMLPASAPQQQEQLGRVELQAVSQQCSLPPCDFVQAGQSNTKASSVLVFTLRSCQQPGQSVMMLALSAAGSRAVVAKRCVTTCSSVVPQHRTACCMYNIQSWVTRVASCSQLNSHIERG